MYIEDLSEEQKQKIETTFEKEINDYLNKIICKEKFIHLIKRCNIMEFCYIYKKYIGEIKVITILPEIFPLESYDYLIETNDKVNISYNYNLGRKKHPKKACKKLQRIEKIAKKQYYKQRRCEHDRYKKY